MLTRFTQRSANSDIIRVDYAFYYVKRVNFLCCLAIFGIKKQYTVSRCSVRPSLLILWSVTIAGRACTRWKWSITLRRPFLFLFFLFLFWPVENIFSLLLMRDTYLGHSCSCTAVSLHKQEHETERRIYQTIELYALRDLGEPSRFPFWFYIFTAPVMSFSQLHSCNAFGVKSGGTCVKRTFFFFFYVYLGNHEC